MLKLGAFASGYLSWPFKPKSSWYAATSVDKDWNDKLEQMQMRPTTCIRKSGTGRTLPKSFCTAVSSCALSDTELQYSKVWRERGEERRGEGWGYRTVVARPTGGRQEEMRIIAAAAGGTALLIPTGQHGGTEWSGLRQKSSRWNWNSLSTVLFFYF